MPRILEQALHCGQVLLLAFALALAGCGPGTGGTGTGPIGLTFSGSAGSGSFTPSPGTACAWPACDRVDLRLEDGRIEAFSGCSRFLYLGDWAVDDSGQLQVEGTVETTTPDGTATRAATLQLRFSGRDLAQANVHMVLVDDNGLALIEPRNLLPEGEAPPRLGGC